MRTTTSAAHPADFIDPRPGRYYVSVVDGPRYQPLVGPFATHAEALAAVTAAKQIAFDLWPAAVFMTVGTCRMPDDYAKLGRLQQVGRWPACVVAQ